MSVVYKNGFDGLGSSYDFNSFYDFDNSGDSAAEAHCVVDEIDS